MELRQCASLLTGKADHAVKWAHKHWLNFSQRGILGQEHLQTNKTAFEPKTDLDLCVRVGVADICANDTGQIGCDIRRNNRQLRKINDHRFIVLYSF